MTEVRRRGFRTQAGVARQTVYTWKPRLDEGHRSTACRERESKDMVVTKPWPKKKKHGADGFCIAEPSSPPERGS